ncbi:hypothetical protein BV25DRAFT_1901690 [Artomyces pyxidatus]|uniref:Uncharacterized protein n=1 Tax=Artomyces pyxidatus TaxID=48021 RepID=A0ACB8SRM5_9AGAM|nr:hypothetical protein BV25DRAFT_1901690 [Artomyces pyxidatus]
MSDAPRRSSRASVRTAAPTPAPVASSSRQTPRPARTKAVKKAIDPDEQLRILLHEPTSALVGLDLSDIINATTLASFSPATQARLAALLPPSAFKSFIPTLGNSHPSLRQEPPPDAPVPDDSDVEMPTAASSPLTQPPSSPLSPPPSSPPAPAPSQLGPEASAESWQFEDTPPDVDPAFFTSPHFLSAMRTFQDHLYTGWLTAEHDAVVREYSEGVQAGTMHAPWKDVVWESEHGADEYTPEKEEQKAGDGLGKRVECKLSDLARAGFLKVDDLIAYKRRFMALSSTIESDVLIISIDPKSYSMDVRILTGPAAPLASSFVDPDPDKSVSIGASDNSEVTVLTAAQLETAILDGDGRVPRLSRPNGNAWKVFTVWRLPETGIEDDNGQGHRSGRVIQGTLFYLRSCYLSDQ